MMQYKAIKLKSGELMACGTEQEINTRTLSTTKFVTVHNPVVFNSFKFMDEAGELVETISMQPMIPIAEQSILEISTDCIMTVATLQASAADKYALFLSHYSDISNDESNEEQMDLLEELDDLEDAVGFKILH